MSYERDRMAIFSTSSPTYQVTAVPNNTATQIYNSLGPSSTGIASGTILSGLTIVNDGPNTAYIGRGSVTSAIGLPLSAGAQMTWQDSQAAGATTAPWNIYAIVPTGTATLQVGLSSVAVVV